MAVSAVSGKQKADINRAAHLLIQKKNLIDQRTGGSGFITWR
jgi:hypothetical protein